MASLVGWGVCFWFALLNKKEMVLWGCMHGYWFLHLNLMVGNEREIERERGSRWPTRAIHKHLIPSSTSNRSHINHESFGPLNPQRPMG